MHTSVYSLGILFIQTPSKSQQIGALDRVFGVRDPGFGLDPNDGITSCSMCLKKKGEFREARQDAYQRLLLRDSFHTSAIEQLVMASPVVRCA